MRTFLKVVGFSLLAVGFFSAYSSFGIPQVRPAPPPAAEAVDQGGVTMDGFIALGGRLFAGKGTCVLCHNPVGGRAPLLDKAATVAAERLADPRYKGKATSAEEYLMESMTAPSAYVVAGFGKSGSNDTESPMPNVADGSIGLTQTEMKAIVAHLQALAGEEVTVAIPTGTEEETSQAEPVETRRPRVATPEEAIETFSCGACHKVAGQEGEVGPDLTMIGAVRTKDYLRRAILDPNAEIAPGFEKDQMPPDYGEQLYAAELEMLVEYLAGLK